MSTHRPVQSRLASLSEAIANLLAGFWLAMMVQVLVFPLFGIVSTFVDHAAIAAIFSAISLLRSYLMRRLFEWVSTEPADGPTARDAS